VSLFFGKPESETRDLTTDGWYPIGDGRPTTVTESRALALAPVFAAIRHIVDYCATTPVDYFRKSGTSRIQMGTAPVLFRNLDEAGELETWLTKYFYSLVTRGSAVGIVLARDGADRSVTNVEWVPMDHVSVDDSNFRTPIWRIGGQRVDNPARDLLHVPWISVPGRTLGLSPLEAYAASVNAGLSAQEYADLKRGGGTPPAHLKNNRLVLDSEASTAVQSRAVKSFASGKPFVTGSDWDLTMISIPPNQTEFVKTLNMTANQVASVYGIDPTEVGGEPPGSLTYSTDESRQIKRAHNMQPYLIRTERAFAARLPQRQFIKFNVDAKIRADLKTRWEVNKTRVEMKAASLNEIRAQEDQEPIPGGDFATPDELSTEVSMALDLARGAPSLLQNPGLVELVRQIREAISGPPAPPAEPTDSAPEGEIE